MTEAKETVAQKLRVGLLGCTGTVGQRFIQILEKHPYFEVSVIGASANSAGSLYKERVRWKLNTPIPCVVGEMKIVKCDDPAFLSCNLIFSALDASVAGPLETNLAEAGLPVFTNAKSHRMDPRVPIVIPYVNADHIALAGSQIEDFPKGGFIVANANCSSTGLVVPLKALDDRFGLDKVFVVTLQAISGAGYPGVSAFDITDNVIPHIGGEEPKLEAEPLKILGNFGDGQINPADFVVSAMCNRVAVLDGHTECVSVKLRSTTATPEDVIECFEQFTSEAHSLNLPSAPSKPLVYLSAADRPQPRLDRDLENGYVVTVGRVQKCSILDIKFTICSHNTVLGAAGGSILNAELAHAKGLLTKTVGQKEQ